MVFRKITALYLIAVLLLPCFFTVRAEENKDNIDGYYIYDVRSYDPITDGALLGAVITGVTDRDALPEDISIPDTLGGYPVKEIGGKAFWGCNNIRSVFIPNSIISIHPNAFSYCSNLTALHADPDTTPRYTHYSSKDGVLFNKDQTVLTHYPQGIQNAKYTVPDGVTRIGSYAFFNQSYLTEVDIPSSVTVIAPHAFEGAIIQSVVLPDNLTAIGENAFTGAFIQSVAIPAKVEGIGSSAFSGCKDLTSVTIADGVKYIDSCAFSDCSFENLFIPKSMVTIDATAFSNCWNLTAIEVAENNPNYLSRDGILFNKAQTALIKYPQNNAVKDYGVPDGVTEILPDAFSGCENLSSVKLPESVTTIGEFAFLNCWSLTAIEVAENNYNYLSRDGILFNKAQTALIKYPQNNAVKDYGVPDGVTEILPYAFSGCGNLSSVKLPESVKTIGEFAFLNCWSLTALYIPESVTEIGKNAFSGCNNLSFLRLPVKFKDSASDLGLSSVKDVSYFCMVDYILQKENGVLSKLSRIRVDYGDPLPVYKDLPTLGKGFRYIYYQLVYTSLSDGSLVLRDKQKLSSNEVVTADRSVLICKEAVQCTVTLTEGDTVTEKNVWIDSAISEFFTEEKGYHYSYVLNGISCDNTAIITEENNKLVITRTPILHTVTFVGDYEGTQTVPHNGYATVPDAGEGYEYSFRRGSFTLWDPSMPITEDITVQVTRILKTYTVTLIGDVRDEQRITAGRYIDPPTQEGYEFSYTVGGQAWDPNTPITSDLTVTVTKRLKTYIVTFIGDWKGTETVAHGGQLTKLPEIGATYIYQYTAGGRAWDPASPITSDLTVRVTRVITAYTATFAGDYEGTQIVAKNTAIQSPPIETGYVYRYTDESNRPWSPDTAVTRDITLTVKKLNDRCEVLNILGCDNLSVDAENHTITATVYQKRLRLTPVISAGAACVMKSANNETVYDSNGDTDTALTLDYGVNEYALTVTAESGKIAAYTLKITLEKVSDLGYMTALTYGRTIGFQPTKKIKGSPTIKARYSKDNNRWSYTDAEYNPDVNMIYVKNLESSTTYYFIIEADYGYEAPVCNTNTPIMVKTGLSDECLILCANTPPSTDVDHENGTVSGLWVQNIFSTCDIDITVSDGATWEMFLSPDMETPAKSKTVALEEGKTTNVYIRVTAEDRISTKTYTLPIYRWTKSDQPKIGIENGLVCITARENSAIYYTVDGSYPTPGSKTTLLYTKPFLCADRKTVKAIAKDRDRDEASEPVGFEVRGAAKTAITSAVFSSASANQYSYEVYLETLEEIGLSGTLYIAAYDDRGVLTAIETVAVNTNQKDHLETGTLFPAAAPKKYTVYFCDAALKPLTEKR